MNASLPNILVTGANGQLGQALTYVANKHGYPMIACTKQQLDICNPLMVEQAFDLYQPDMMINTAAYTAVDLAEEEKAHALAINGHGAKHLAIACEKHRIPLIHLSTDYVFDGKTNGPYHEDAPTSPINYYGLSKCKGEEAVREHCEQHLILRVSGVFSPYGTNFLKTILRLAHELSTLRVVSDQTICPTPASAIATALFQLAHGFKTTGTFHFCAKPATSWHAFTKQLIEEAKKYFSLMVENIHAITSEEFPARAKRPRYSVLDCSKIADAYGILQPTWQDGISECLLKLKDTYREKS